MNNIGKSHLLGRLSDGRNSSGVPLALPVMVVLLLVSTLTKAEAQDKGKFGVGIVPFLNSGDDAEQAMHAVVGQFPEIDRMYNPSSPAEFFKILANLKKMGRKVDFL